MRDARERTNSGDKRAYDGCRYFVAFVIVVYGWAKIMGSQFTILDSEVDRPLGEVSGFWLTWYYFGYSPFYGNFIALLQIAGGFFLLYRKTVLLGACILFGVVGNIILIDIFYAIDLGALLMAMALEAALLIILSFHKRDLIEIFWTRQNSIYPDYQNLSLVRAAKIFAVTLVILIPPSLTYWVANYNNRFPTEIDGKWQVVATSAPVTDDDRPLSKIYFEHNRAFMIVFRYGDDRWAEHHFEIDPQTKTIHVWDKWLAKGSPVFSGGYQLEGKKLTLDGRFEPSDQTIRIDLEKR